MSGESKNKGEWVDDGRVIAEMDLDGMPQTVFSAYRSRRKARIVDRQLLREKVARGEALTKREYRRYTFSAVLGGLAAVGIFAAVFLVFILLWLK